MPVLVGGTLGITFPDNSNILPENITAQFSPYITNSSNTTTINQASFIGSVGVLTLRELYLTNYDPYFKQVSLLLHGDGTNRSNNNTFLDSSTNNFTITRNGNTTQGTFTPFSETAGEWSNYFDGTGDYLSVPANAAYAFGTGGFTVECWIYATGASDGRITNRAPGAPLNGSWGFNFGPTSFSFTEVIAGEPGVIASGLPNMQNTWTHLAASRSGTTLRLFANGTQVGSGTFSNNLSEASRPLGIGASYETFFAGYISNVRIVKGTAVYTANFTPPTTPLTAISNTSLLICQSNNFKDNSSNNFTITRTGDTSVQPFSPFTPTSVYSPSVNGGSMYFDGTGDTLTGVSNASLSAGTGAFTFETWFYVNSFPFDATLMNTGLQTNGLQIGRRDFGAADWGVAQSAVAWVLVSTTLPTTGQWNHMVVVRNGSNNMSLFLNGVRLATTSTAYTFTQNGFSVGNKTVGYFSSTRYVVGTAVYDPTLTTLTVPTAPLTAITNTQLLLNGTNAGIFDSAAKNNLETVGNAQVSTSISKFGRGSISFDGTGDYLTVTSSTQYNFGTGDFTIEFWVYLNSISGQPFFFDQRTADTQMNPLIYSSGTGNGIFSYFLNGEVRITASTALTTGQWYHVALCRGSGNTKLFYNGTQTGSTYVDSGTYVSGRLVIGARYSFILNTTTLNGYIDDFRVTKGVARYTANFTPPTTSFANQ